MAGQLDDAIAEGAVGTRHQAARSPHPTVGDWVLGSAIRASVVCGLGHVQRERVGVDHVVIIAPTRLLGTSRCRSVSS